MVIARWGLIPFWFRGDAKDFKLATFNARSDKVKASATFKSAFAKRRCLVPFDSFFEWTGPKGQKQRWEITPVDGSQFLAGLWDRYRDPEGQEVQSYTIITQPAGSPISPDYHDRAPVVLSDDQIPRWLNLEDDCDDIMGPESLDRFSIIPAEPLKMTVT